MLIPQTIKEEYEKYCKLLISYKENLHENDDPLIEDDEYDALKLKIESIEKQYPKIISNNSPIHTIGGKIKKYLTPVKHDVKMESLHDCFTFIDLQKFYKNIKEENCTVEPKIDGLSVSVIYKNGDLSLASTRGNGFIGEEITDNIKKIKNLPHKINENIEFLEVRGEVYMPKKYFLQLIKKYEEYDGTRPFKNPRNAAAGILRSKDSKILENFYLEILFFNVQQIKFKTFEFISPGKFKTNYSLFKTHSNSLEILKSFGLPVVCHYLTDSYEKIIDMVNKIKDNRLDFSYQIDGAVIKVDDLSKRELIGSTDTFPRWAQAFKYESEEKISKILSIENQIGRTGVITPVASFLPVELGGTTVKKASLHNYDYIHIKDIRIGDFVKVRKAGDIVPEIISSIKTNDIKIECEIKDLEHYHNSLPIFNPPKVCPECNSLLFKTNDEVALKCKNKHCQSQICQKLIHFVSRDAMDIDVLGKSTIKKLVHKGILKSFEDIFNITAEIISKENIGSMNKIDSDQIKFNDFDFNVYLKKDIKKIIKKIQESKQKSLEKFIYALGIPLIGRESAATISSKFSDLREFLNASFEDIKSIPGIGELSAKSIIEFFKEEDFDFFKNINFKSDKLNKNLKNHNQTQKFLNKTFVITGKSEKYSRNEVIDIIKNLGGKVSSSVSKNVDFLICGTNPGSKFKKAQEFNIKVLDIDTIDFLK